MDNLEGISMTIDVIVLFTDTTAHSCACYLTFQTKKLKLLAAKMLEIKRANVLSKQRRFSFNYGSLADILFTCRIRKADSNN